jgi:hypothetical protein
VHPKAETKEIDIAGVMITSIIVLFGAAGA